MAVVTGVLVVLVVAVCVCVFNFFKPSLRVYREWFWTPYKAKKSEDAEADTGRHSTYKWSMHILPHP